MISYDLNLEEDSNLNSLVKFSFEECEGDQENESFFPDEVPRFATSYHKPDSGLESSPSTLDYLQSNE